MCCYLVDLLYLLLMIIAACPVQLRKAINLPGLGDLIVLTPS